MFLRTFFLVQVVVCAILALPSQAVLQTPSKIEADGYVCEVHHVTTPDGYILEMHRIPYRRFSNDGDPDRPVVFMMHGLLAASQSFISYGPQGAIGYNLADAGFDVWMGNARGNQLSRAHVSMDPDNREEKMEFFDFSWEQIGMIDVASMIDHALNNTGKEKLHYIGHSQGGTSFLVLTSMRPEYNEKMASVHLLAGVGYMEYFPNFFLRNIAQYTYPIWGFSQSIGIVEMYPPTWFPFGRASNNKTAGDLTQAYEIADYCTGDPALKNYCDLIGVREFLPNLDRNALTEGLGGASLKQIAHYGQNIKVKTFQRWDYGSEENLEVYGTMDPPAYDLSLITADVTMHYTVSDTLLDERDVLAMAKVMPNTVVRKVARESFSHVGFIDAPDAKELVTDYIIQYIRAFEHGSQEEPLNSAGNVALSVFFKIWLIVFTLRHFCK